MILCEQNWFSVSKFDSLWANLLSKFLLTINLLIVSNFFSEQFSWAVSNFFADLRSKIIALADQVLSQPDMEQEMVSTPAGAYIPSFTIYDVSPDLPVHSLHTNSAARALLCWCWKKEDARICEGSPSVQCNCSSFHPYQQTRTIFSVACYQGLARRNISG